MGHGHGRTKLVLVLVVVGFMVYVAVELLASVQASLASIGA